MESWDKPTVDHFGPHEHYDVLIDGRRVPFVTSMPMNGGLIRLMGDGGAVLDCTVAEAESIMPFVADCIAVALGYTMHPRADMEEPFRRPPFVRVHTIITETTEDGA